MSKTFVKYGFVFPKAQAADVLYKNKPVSENRLKLAHAFQLNSQIQLDSTNLKRLQKPWTRPASHVLKVTSNIICRPGLEVSDNAEVTLQVPASSLGLKGSELHAAKVLAQKKYYPRNGTISFSCHKFPFVEQNTKYLLNVIKELIVQSKTNVDLCQEAFVPRSSLRITKIPNWVQEFRKATKKKNIN